MTDIALSQAILRDAADSLRRLASTYRPGTDDYEAATREANAVAALVVASTQSRARDRNLVRVILKHMEESYDDDSERGDRIGSDPWIASVLDDLNATHPRPASGYATRENVWAVVAALVADISDRRGLKWEWERIEPSIQEEIREKWAALITRILGEAPRPETPYRPGVAEYAVPVPRPEAPTVWVNASEADALRPNDRHGQVAPPTQERGEVSEGLRDRNYLRCVVTLSRAEPSLPAESVIFQAGVPGRVGDAEIAAALVAGGPPPPDMDLLREVGVRCHSDAQLPPSMRETLDAIITRCLEARKR